MSTPDLTLKTESLAEKEGFYDKVATGFTFKNHFRQVQNASEERGVCNPQRGKMGEAGLR